MAGPIAIDTPDYQRGIFNPQLLLATVPAGQNSVVVGIPTNAETLIVIAAGIATTDLVDVVGVGTATRYPGVYLPGQPRIVSTPSWIFDVSATTDSQVSVGFTSPPTATWYVYADAGTHLTADVSLVKNTLGQAYVIPSVPSTLSADHPPNELQWGTTGVSDGQNVQGPLSATERYRVFTAQIANFSVAAECELLDSTGSWFFQTSSINPGIFGAWPLTGIPLTAGSPIGARVTNGASCAVSLGFTIETL